MKVIKSQMLDDFMYNFRSQSSTSANPNGTDTGVYNDDIKRWIKKLRAQRSDNRIRVGEDFETIDRLGELLGDIDTGENIYYFMNYRERKGKHFDGWPCIRAASEEAALEILKESLKELVVKSVMIT